MQQDAALAWPTRSMIVLIALLQGLALYAAQELNDTAPFQDIACRYAWNAWVLTVPTAVALTLVDLKDRRLWLHAALASLLVVALAGWVGWTLRGMEGRWTSARSEPLAVGLAVATFVLLPWWQFRMQHGSWRADHAALFDRAWQNGLVLLQAAVFTGLGWMLLWLWAALFTLVEVTFFQQLFAERAFVALATGTLAGFGVLIGRTQHRAIQITRQVLFAICRALLPLLAFIAVLFVVSLPFTGLMSGAGYRSPAKELLTLALLLICLVNAVYQRSDSELPYPRLLRRAVEAGLLTLPIYAGLALYALALRIAQYGWTIDRFWATAAALITAGYALGYALAVVRPGARWLQGVEPVNRVMSWAVIAVAILGNSPILDPARIAAASVAERLRSNPAQLVVRDVSYLREHTGRRGVDVLRRLQQDPAIQADRRASSIIAQQLSGKKMPGYRQENLAEAGVYDLPTLKARIHLAKGSASPPDSWWQAVLDDLDSTKCLSSDDGCIALQRDVDGDGRPDVLLCQIRKSWGPECDLHTLDQGKWRSVGQFRFGTADAQATTQALREGRLQLRESRWPEFLLDDQTSTLQYNHDFGERRSK